MGRERHTFCQPPPSRAHPENLSVAQWDSRTIGWEFGLGRARFDSGIAAGLNPLHNLPATLSPGRIENQVLEKQAFISGWRPVPFHSVNES